MDSGGDKRFPGSIGVALAPCATTCARGGSEASGGRGRADDARGSAVFEVGEDGGTASVGDGGSGNGCGCSWGAGGGGGGGGGGGDDNCVSTRGAPGFSVAWGGRWSASPSPTICGSLIPLPSAAVIAVVAADAAAAAAAAVTVPLPLPPSRSGLAGGALSCFFSPSEMIWEG